LQDSFCFFKQYKTNIMKICKNFLKYIKSRPLSLILTAFIITMVLWAIYTYIVNCFYKHNCIPYAEQMGFYGDSFGGINAIFSVLAFFGVLITISLQERGLKIQLNGLKNQWKHIKAQELNIKKQQFDTTFFNMCNLLQQIVTDLRYEDFEGNKIQGRYIFYYLFNTARFDYKGKQYRGMEDYLKRHGRTDFEIQELTMNFDHYFRYLYRILKYIDKNDFFSDDKKYEYAGTLRGMLSRSELLWIFYNGLTENGEKLKPLLEKYSMLKNIRKESLALSINNNHGCNIKEINEKKDYYFYLTDDKKKSKNTDKYYIGAFVSKNDYTGFDIEKKNFKNIIKNNCTNCKNKNRCKLN